MQKKCNNGVDYFSEHNMHACDLVLLPNRLLSNDSRPAFILRLSVAKRAIVAGLLGWRSLYLRRVSRFSNHSVGTVLAF